MIESISYVGAAIGAAELTDKGESPWSIDARAVNSRIAESRLFDGHHEGVEASVPFNAVPSAVCCQHKKCR